MTPIAIIVTRLRRLPRPLRIQHLRSIIQNYPERSVRRNELEALLKVEMLAQLKKECAA